MARASWHCAVASRSAELPLFGRGSIVVEWLDARNIALRETGRPRDMLGHAIRAAELHGIGRKTLSNFDCFHYACAKTLDQAILTLDKHLQQTDADTLPASH